MIHYGRRYHPALSISPDHLVECLVECLAERLLTDNPLNCRSDDASSLNIYTVEGKGATAEAEMQSQTTSKAPATPATAPSYPGALKQAILVIALILAMFIVALDMVGSRLLVFSWLISSSKLTNDPSNRASSPPQFRRSQRIFTVSTRSDGMAPHSSCAWPCFKVSGARHTNTFRRRLSSFPASSLSRLEVSWSL